MKRILITGASSYIGTSFERYLKSNYPDQYVVDTIDVTNESWRKKVFSGYDAVFHVAGIAHVKETKKNAFLYYKVNRDLALECASKAKQERVPQFIFLSSMSVYGLNVGHISPNTVPHPTTNYGKSKLEAEEKLLSLATHSFSVSILRPPMIYGKGCKGNYNNLRSLVLRLPIFPDIKNERSMLYIENLCEFVRLLVKNRNMGLFFPQNEEYLRTSDIARLICESNEKKFHSTKFFNPVLPVMKKVTTVAEKAFGSLVYDMKMSEYPENYRVVNTVISIKKTEEK